MLSGVLDNNYKRYKADTSIFVKWLLENGTKCGYQVAKPSTPAKSNAAPQSEAKAPRLKGKARKEAKKGGPASSSAIPPSASTPPKSKNFLVNSKELLALANAIVDSKKPVQVPADIIRAGLRAVSARKRSAAFFQNQTDTDDTETAVGNEGHSYFISLMEQVLSALQPCFSIAAGAACTEPTSSDNIFRTLENRFATLEVEEPVEPTTGPAPKPAAEQPLYELDAQEANKDEERLFAIFCLFDDLARLRTFVRNLWEQFKLRKVDLITASVTTNTAFQLAIRAQDETLVDFPASADYQMVLGVIISYYAKMQKADIQEGAEGEIEMDDGVAEWIYAPTHSILDSFCDVLTPNNVPMMKRGHLGVYNPRADRSRMSPIGRQNEDTILLMEVLPEFCFLSKFKIHMFATDELTRGLGNMALTKEIPVWLTFAVTVFLDIHHILRDKVGLGLAEMQVRGTKAKSTLEQYFSLSKSLLKPTTWPKNNEIVFLQIKEEIDKFILKDVVFPFKAQQHRLFKIPAPGSSENFYLYMRHPVLCGIQSFAVLLELQQAGIILNNAVGTVIYPAHFYNALKVQVPSCTSWPMMDEVIAMHGPERIFIGGKPTTMLDCWKQICLMLGYSSAQFAKNRRGFKPVISKNGPRGLRETSPITELFYQGLRGKEGKMALTMHNVEALLNEQALSSSLAANITTSASNQKLRRQLSAKKLTSVEFLSALSISLPNELPKLEFDYFKLYEQSIGLLRRLKKEMDEDYKELFGGMYIENESQLPYLGPYAVMAACRTGKVAGEMELGEGGSRLLGKAARVLEEYLREEGAI